MALKNSCLQDIRNTDSKISKLMIKQVVSNPAGQQHAILLTISTVLYYL